ncbi:MAG: SDR family oxidoreductase [Truepera sp.]|nr:SDR family oxidoreductase [Truepera sp.]
MDPYAQMLDHLRRYPKRWLITGVAGFIGSSLLQQLLALNQKVVGLDNFATGFRHNLEDVCAAVGSNWENFTFLEGDITDLAACRTALRGVELSGEALVVLHHAAFVSVPASLEDPLTAHQVNVEGFMNLLTAAREAGVKRLVYAATSASYGDDPAEVKREEVIGKPLSPYALTKTINELYAELYGRLYGLETVGLRYFNIFGRRQDPNGAYAAVIPKWIASLLNGERCIIFGDGETTRDFCHIDNVVQANLLAATTQEPAALGTVYNIGNGGCTTLNVLYTLIRDGLAALDPAFAQLKERPAEYGPFRPGDVRHSQADIGKAARLLGYRPSVSVAEGLHKTLAWYVAQTRG